MSRAARNRTQDCTTADARSRLADAHAYLAQAELADVTSAPAEQKAAMSSAVLAGIAAADAACCAARGRRSRGQDHREAAALVRDVEPGGAAAANHLNRLLALKDRAQYGFEPVTAAQLTTALRAARALVAFAGEAVRG